jgi:hypothetical protein
VPRIAFGTEAPLLKEAPVASGVERLGLAHFGCGQSGCVLLNFFRHVVGDGPIEPGPQEIEQQHSAWELGIIQSLVLGGVVEDEAPPLFPRPRLCSDPKTAARWDDESEVQPVNARCPADVGLDLVRGASLEKPAIDSPAICWSAPAVSGHAAHAAGIGWPIAYNPNTVHPPPCILRWTHGSNVSWESARYSERIACHRASRAAANSNCPGETNTDALRRCPHKLASATDATKPGLFQEVVGPGGLEPPTKRL